MHSFRATEADIQELFQWASSGHERTVNQRIRPGLLIVINKLTGKADPEWLNVDYATEKLLSHLELSGAFSELKDQWAKRGKTIRTAQDLILCYYASFRVICVPDLPGGTAGIKAARYVAEQYRKLYWEICLASRQQRDKKISVGMNPDVESFNTYVEHAFNRLSRDLKSSIDFYYLSSRDETIPSKVSEHLTALIVKMLRMGNYGRSNELLQEEKLLRRLIPYLAWCIGMQIQSSNEAPTESGMWSSALFLRVFVDILD